MAMVNVDVQSVISSSQTGVELRAKVVPNASRTRIAGLLGDRVKVAVASPAEGGKANKAVCRLLADVFGIPARDVAVVSGATQPLKTIELTGISLCDATTKLKAILEG